MPMEKTFNPAEAEARIAARWDEANAFAAGANASRPETFSIVIPPPNVTGSLHMGHAFNNTLQDILTRWHRMRGFDTLWQPGTDHAGIATQMVVERELGKEGKRRTDFTREDFTKLVWEQKKKSRGNIIGQLKRLGASADWAREAFTMSGAPGAPEGEEGNFHDAVIKVFVDMYQKGLIYRGKRLVNWDPHFETAISDLEVEQTEVAGHMWHFKYPLAGGETYIYREKDEDGEVIFEEERNYISIATTRPETMLGDGAIAVNPADERYQPIIGKMVELPAGPEEGRRLIPIIADPYPEMDFGSGAVKITGAHDFNDYQVAKRANLPLYRLMDTKARMRTDGYDYATSVAKAREIAAGAPFTEGEVDLINLVPDAWRGLDRYECRKAVIEQVTGDGFAVTELVKEIDPETNAEDLSLVPVVEDKKIMQPFGDRSKVVIEPMLTDQWFVDTAKIVEPALDAVRSGKTKIIPESGEKTYYHWLENIEPWCISRQLWWGHQIPVWYGLDIAGGFTDDQGDNALDHVELFRLLNEGHFNAKDPAYFCAPNFDAVCGQFRDALAPLPMPLNHARIVEVETRAEAMDLLVSSLAEYNLSQDPTKLVYPVWREADVLDTWFSSGLWPIGTMGWPEQTPELAKYHPTSVLITGADILFFWVARMMMMQLAVVEDVPFHTVYLHGLVRDAKGKKMSKSLGNVVDPLEIIDEFGADALRFTNAAMASIGGVLKMDMSRITGYRNFGTKLWNATRFAEMNGVWEGHTTQTEAPKATAVVNRWILSEAAKVRAEVDEALENFRFNDAADALYKFVWGKVCDWYVEFAKPLFADEALAAETRATMAFVLDQSMILLHPIMPFITEELWALTGARPKLLVHQDWPTYGDEMIDAEATREMNWVIALIEDIRSARAQMGVPVGLHLPVLMTELDATGRAAFARNEALIKRLARLGDITEGAAPKGSVTIPVEGGAFALPLAGVIDVAAEKARLEKAAAKIEKEAGGLRGRLSNPKFVESAAEEVVEEARTNLALREEELSKLKAALARLAEIG
ncbi:valine--tRNA ligase [Falsigemmobacter intermedius]|uniref:Valine--tRNA ligase n=2 Tax=Falsigemmobacter intermedius TaxID=1553448 RepID=A0A3S3VY02_9RHOB|nr:valine--tRNA ligase [Falsigemmobacter intermedius]RWY44236.1 valine--tRNA ligase [Falsigemmobacter intermedius]